MTPRSCTLLLAFLLPATAGADPYSEAVGIAARCKLELTAPDEESCDDCARRLDGGVGLRVSSGGQGRHAAYEVAYWWLPREGCAAVALSLRGGGGHPTWASAFIAQKGQAPAASTQAALRDWAGFAPISKQHLSGQGARLATQWPTLAETKAQPTPESPEIMVSAPGAFVWTKGKLSAPRDAWAPLQSAEDDEWPVPDGYVRVGPYFSVFKGSDFKSVAAREPEVATPDGDVRGGGKARTTFGRYRLALYQSSARNTRTAIALVDGRKRRLAWVTSAPARITVIGQHAGFIWLHAAGSMEPGFELVAVDPKSARFFRLAIEPRDELDFVGADQSGVMVRASDYEVPESQFGPDESGVEDAATTVKWKALASAIAAAAAAKSP